MVNGEIDRIAMNLFQQLLWEPSHVWKEDPKQETSNNRDATRFAQENGRENIHQFLLSKMNEKWGI